MKIGFLAGFIIGITVFFCAYGIQRVNPQNTEWIWGGLGDLTQHYVGWVAWRDSPWSFPLGLTNRLSYPIQTSIIFTDSIPLWAILFKIASPILPSAFQYLGLFGLISFGLQGAFGMLLLLKLKLPKLISVIGSMMLCLIPTLHLRLFPHTSLSAQWIVLAAILLWWFPARKNISNLCLWSLLALIAVGTHLYLFVMFAIILFGYCLELLITRKNIKYVLAQVFLPILTGGLGLALFGAFVNASNQNNISLPNTYISNIASLFDSDGLSRLIPDLPSVTSGTVEGFIYPGLGFLVLVFISMITSLPNLIKLVPKLFVKHKWNTIKTWLIHHKRMVAITIVMIISFLLGWGSEISFLDKTIFTHPLPNKILELWGIFRATGRFAWLSMYLIAILSFVYVARHFRQVIFYTLIIIALILQFIDLSPLIRVARHEEIIADYTSPLTNPIWQNIHSCKHIYVSQFIDNELRNHLTKYAFDRNLTINNSYFARVIDGVPAPFAKDNDTLYIFNLQTEANEHNLSIHRVDDLFIGFTQNSNCQLQNS